MCSLCSIGRWLETYEARISSIGSIFSAIGVVGGLIMIAITLNSVSDTSKNIRASTLYNIAKDGRSLAKDLGAGTAGPGFVFNYVQSVFYQKELGTLDDELWTPITYEFCDYIKDDPKVESYWTASRKKLFGSKFVIFADTMIQREDCKK